MTETVLAAIGSSDDTRVEAFCDQLRTVATPETTVVLAHIFDEDSYDRVLAEYHDLMGRMDVPTSQSPSPTEVARTVGPISDMQDRLTAQPFDIEVRGTVGDRSDEILALAAEIEADNLLVGGRKRSPAGKAMFGSSAQQVLLNAPCPVTFIRDDLAASA